ncbi:MAG: hypothetical protein ACUVTL_00035 [Thermoproteota archaeon]
MPYKGAYVKMEMALLSFRSSLLSGIILSISLTRFFRLKKHLPQSVDSLVLDRSVSEEMAKAYRDELRILEVRLEALRSLVERLRDSHERGLITNDEFNALSKRHEEEIRQLSHHLVGRRLVVELFELEEIREKIANAFSKKISELNETIMMVRRKLGFDQVLSQQKIEVPLLKPNEIPLAPSAPSPSNTETIASSRTREHVSIPKELSKDEEHTTKPKLDTAKKEEEIEDELSRIRADVESLLQELEQMEKNRD